MITVGQKGTDVDWVPTPSALVEAMLDLAKLRPDDVLIDLGSGDGRIVIAAAKRGIRKAIGVENNRSLVIAARAHAVEQICADPFPEFRQQNFFDADLSEASVITLFWHTDQKRLLKKFVNELRPGTRIISNTHHLWEHDAEVEMETGTYWKKAMMWQVPEFR